MSAPWDFGNLEVDVLDAFSGLERLADKLRALENRVDTLERFAPVPYPVHCHRRPDCFGRSACPCDPSCVD